MTEKVMQLGRPVLMAGFQAASDQAFPRRPMGQPMITAGTICCYDRDFELAAATYQGGRSSATAPLNSWDPLHRIISPSCREQCSSLVAHTHVIWNAACTFYRRIHCGYPSVYVFCNNISCGNALHLCDDFCALQQCQTALEVLFWTIPAAFGACMLEQAITWMSYTPKTR